MKTRQWVVTMLAAAVMGGCVVPDHPRPVVVEHHHGNPYLVGDGIDMGAPVYFSAYPDHAFYHRYDRHCDCIRIVRLVSSGGAVFWVDQFGKRVHEGHWEPARPSAHALNSYRGWSRQHYSELHRAPPPGHRMAPPPPAPPPAPVPHIGGHRDHPPGPVVRPPPPAPPVAPVPVVKPFPHGKGDRAAKPGQIERPIKPAKPGQIEHPVKPAKPGQIERPIKPAKPGQADQPVKPAPTVQPVKPAPAVSPVKPEPAIQPGKTVPPAPAAQPVKPVPAVPPEAAKAMPAKGDVPATAAAKEAPK